MPVGTDPSAYYLLTDEVGQPPNPWGWEICRRDALMGVGLRGQGFRSGLAAEFAGQRALTEFLQELSQELRRSPDEAFPADRTRVLR
jgi:hypothetical protein